MTLLRLRTARQLAPGSHSPVVYRRPVLRAFSGVVWLFTTGGLAWLDVAGSSSTPPDDLGRANFWLPLFFVAVLGGFYLYAASTLVVTADTVIVENPLRRAAIPFAQITGVETGRNLQVITAHRTFTSAGVEGANIQLAFGSMGTQDALAQRIERDARAAAGRDRGEPAQWRWVWPGPFTLLVAAANVASAGELLVVGGPLTG